MGEQEQGALCGGNTPPTWEFSVSRGVSRVQHDAVEKGLSQKMSPVGQPTQTLTVGTTSSAWGYGSCSDTHRFKSPKGRHFGQCPHFVVAFPLQP